MDKPSIELGPPQVLIFGIGGLIFYYGRLEHWIDGAVAAIFNRVPGAQKIKARHPTNAAEEIEFLKECLARIPELSSYRAHGLKIIEKIEHISDVRHGIAHGHLRLWDQKNDILEFTRLRRVRKEIRRETLVVSSKQITASMLYVRDLADAVRHFAQTLIFEFCTEEERKEFLSTL
ncbi:hypothetical protein [uncultured Reyranella sp.]|jgi:hypothetical protein|uniref:hypothetical protein n=1 Tax=uncultured Reyranella sp. TaxID=735512 RepID=UPI00259D169E|nr:hypothetical protein [uncultured Reyranella sp.]